MRDYFVNEVIAVNVNQLEETSAAYRQAISDHSVQETENLDSHFLAEGEKLEKFLLELAKVLAEVLAKVSYEPHGYGHGHGHGHHGTVHKGLDSHSGYKQAGYGHVKQHKG